MSDIEIDGETIEPGMLIDKYEIINKFGSGAFSEKNDQFIGIRVKNIIVANKSNTYLFFSSTRIIMIFY